MMVYAMFMVINIKKESVIYSDSSELGVEVINLSKNAKKIDDEWFYFRVYDY